MQQPQNSNSQYPQQQLNPQSPQQPYALPGTALCNREILGPYHAVELYQDGALWIIDQVLYVHIELRVHDVML